MEERFTQRLKHNSERVDPWEDSSEKLRYRSEGDDHNRVDDYNRGGRRPVFSRDIGVPWARLWDSYRSCIRQCGKQGWGCSLDLAPGKISEGSLSHRMGTVVFE